MLQENRDAVSRIANAPAELLQLRFQNFVVGAFHHVGNARLKSGQPRGDRVGNKFDIADAIYTVYSVLGDANYPMPCKDAGDADANTRVEFPDAVYIVNWQFRGGAAPSAPFPACGDGSSTEMCPQAATQAKCQ